MFRKITLALAAATVVAVAAIPTSASAHWTGWRHYHRDGVVVRIGGPVYAYGHRFCHVTHRWVHTRWGWQRIKIRRCHY